MNLRHASAGFTLLEIVIAMSIGLILLAALTSSYVAMRRSARLGRDLGLTQDAARDTVLIVERSLRLAGYLPAPASIRDPARIFRAPWLAVQGGHGTPPFPGASAARGSGDWVAVSYAGDFPPNRSCLGDPVGRHQIALNLFYLGRADADSAGTLRCATLITHFDDDGGPSQPIHLNRSEPLVDGVVGLRVLYGVDDAAGKIRYATADAVHDWHRVRLLELQLDIAAPGSHRRSPPGVLTTPSVLTTLFPAVALRNRLLP